MKIEAKAPAKINLGLRIGSRREDGYHTLETVFQTIDLLDELTISFGSGESDDRLTVHGTGELPSGPENLAIRAVQLLRERSIPFPPVHIELKKNIPIGAGLGGGSSDAAAVLRAIHRRLDSSVQDQLSLRSLATVLGADVPFFLEGGTRLARGIGDQLSELPDLEGVAVIGVPEYSVSTPWAYSNYRHHLPEGRNGTHGILPENFSSDEPTWREFQLFNDFEPLIERTFELHSELRSAIGRWTQQVSLSGSGSAVYGLFDRKDVAEGALRELRDQFPEVRWFLSRFLGEGSIQQNSCGGV